MARIAVRIAIDDHLVRARVGSGLQTLNLRNGRKRLACSRLRSARIVYRTNLASESRRNCSWNTREVLPNLHAAVPAFSKLGRIAADRLKIRMSDFAEIDRRVKNNRFLFFVIKTENRAVLSSLFPVLRAESSLSKITVFTVFKPHYYFSHIPPRVKWPISCQLKFPLKCRSVAKLKAQSEDLRQKFNS